MLTTNVELCGACNHQMDKHVVVNKTDAVIAMTTYFLCDDCFKGKDGKSRTRCVRHVTKDFSLWFVEERDVN